MRHSRYMVAVILRDAYLCQPITHSATPAAGPNTIGALKRTNTARPRRVGISQAANHLASKTDSALEIR